MCSAVILPFNWICDDSDFTQALYELYSDCVIDMDKISQMIFNPFTINDRCNIPLFDVDPDSNYFNEISHSYVGNSNYMNEDEFNRSCKNTPLNTFSLFHANARSLPAHIVEFEAYFGSLNHNFTVIGMTETWLKEVNIGVYSIMGYNHIGKYRDHKCGGGVSLFVKQDIPFQYRADLSTIDDCVECIFIEIHKNVLQYKKNVLVGVIYRPPNTCPVRFKDELEKLLESIHREHKCCYIMGDFNLDLLKIESHIPTADYMDLMFSFSYIPMINRPTRVTQSSATLIDNIFVNDYSQDNVYNSGILITDITDHFPVYSISSNIRVLSDQQCRVIRKINSATQAEFLEKLQKINWDDIYQSDDTEHAFNIFHNTISSLYNEVFPKILVKSVYRNRKPWLSDGLKYSIKVKNRLYKKSKSVPTASNIRHYKNYKIRLNTVLKDAEKRHYHDLFIQLKSNIRKSWQVIKGLINKSQHSIPQTVFKHNDILLNDGADIANHFNNFFVNIGPTLASRIKKTNATHTQYLKGNYVNSMFMSDVTDNEIDNLLKSLKDSAAGWDDIDPKVIKISHGPLTKPLVHLCNLSLNSGVFPHQLKLAKVTPIYKTGDVMLFNNYRPVSVLPVFSKLFEKVMYKRFLDYLIRYKILYEFQFGFRYGHSTYMSLIILIDKISNALENGEYVLGLYLDFSKAFDTIDHDILFQKLYHYGIRGVPLNWFKSYISNRLQYVSYNGYASATKNVTCGVPQGSVLGPLLFLVYVNDLAYVSPKLFSTMFADDTNMFMSGKNVLSLATEFNTELVQVVKWLQVNKLSLNIDKTHYMLFKGNKTLNSNILIEIDGKPIQKVNKTKFLGVIMDDKLTWKHHIEYISSKISKGIGIIYKVREYLNKETLVNLYYTFIYPYFSYCNEVWGSTYACHLKKLTLLQKRAIRILCNKSRSEHTNPLFHNLNILKFRNIHRFVVAQFMFKLYHGKLPSMFENMFCLNQSVHHYSTRQATLLHIPTVMTNRSKQTTRYEGCIIWNEVLKSNIPVQCSLPTFKYHFKRYLNNEIN